MRVWRAIESSLVVAGLLAVDVWIWSHAMPALYDAWENREFDQEVQSPAPPSQSPPIAPPKNGTMLGRLSIPRLRLHAIVREGDGENTLSLALGHIPNTALPGQIGNVGVAGHRDTIFRSLRGIRKNDLIEIETRHGNYVYRVDMTEIVKPSNIGVLHSDGAPELTLVTCYPFQYVGSAPDRFIVRARQVPNRVVAFPSPSPVRTRKSRRV